MTLIIAGTDIQKTSRKIADAGYKIKATSVEIEKAIDAICDELDDLNDDMFWYLAKKLWEYISKEGKAVLEIMYTSL